ncbi:MAG: DUF475 domain-containing protein [Rhodocyclaceae bacterium]|nr:DUF475 domain-containing protein [Rhodocyclaceae bacterium]
MKPAAAHFTASFAFAAIAVAAALPLGGPQAAATVVFLGVLETSLSFDNAVVNATVLAHWNDVWRRRFLSWGIVVAVFGMRLVFPLLIVGIAGNMGPLEALDLALHDADQYGRVLASAHHQIAAFGGAFLMMVFLKFFAARHKTRHWFAMVERPLTRLGKMEAIEGALTLAILLLAARLLDGAQRAEFVEAGVWGVVVFILVKGLSGLLGGGADGAPSQIVRQGIAGFLYLEVLDASFSFDGVIGAFAITNNLLVIALGLGVGAMFVRSFTLLLVERGTLNTYRYLEHGAFWAIGALAAVMFAGVACHIPEAVTGLVGALLIVLSLGSSIRANRKAAPTKP